MIFTKLGGVVAWLALVFGTIRVAMGFLIALSENREALSKLYLGSKTTGQAIDGGVMMLLFGIGLGILVEISRSVHRADK